MVGRQRARVAVALLEAVVVCAAVLVGCSPVGFAPPGGSGTPTTATSTPLPMPAILSATSEARLTPGDEWEGGSVAFSVAVADVVAGDVVRIAVWKPEGSAVMVPLASSDGSTYSGTYTVPPNVSERDLTYSFAAEIMRGDTILARSSAGSATVPHAIPPTP